MSVGITHVKPEGGIVADGSLLDGLVGFKRRSRIDRPDQVMRLLHDVSHMVQPGSGPFLQHQIVWIVLAMQQCTYQALAHTRVFENPEAERTIEGHSCRDIRHKNLKMV